jgi:hypothetical protein
MPPSLWALRPVPAVGPEMSIDNGSSGYPQINVHKRTTKVNLGIVVSILVFFALMTAMAVWVSREDNHDLAPGSVVAP